MIQQHTANLNNIYLHYAEAPEPDPCLVILHGNTGSHTSFLPFLPTLAQHAHVYALDLRGHGLSGHTPNAYHLSDYGQDVHTFLQTIVGKPAFVAGHSMGGLIAIWLASQAANWVRGIFLEDPPLYLTRLPSFAETGFYYYFRELRHYLPQHHASGGTLEDLIAYVGQSFANESQTMLEAVGSAAVQERAIQLHQLDPTTLDVAIAGTLLEDYEPDDLLAQVRCPVYLLAGQREFHGAMDAQDVARFLGKLPQATHTICEGVGHMIHQERPEAYVQALQQFIAQSLA